MLLTADAAPELAGVSACAGPDGATVSVRLSAAAAPTNHPVSLMIALPLSSSSERAVTSGDANAANDADGGANASGASDADATALP